MTAEPASGPQIVTSMRTHPKVLVVPAFWGLVVIVAFAAALKYVPAGWAGGHARLALTGVAVLALLIWCVLPILRWMTSTFTVTTRELQTRRGLLYRRSRDLPISSISEVTCEQGILDRIFRCGTLIVAEPATVDGVRFPDIPHVKHVRETIAQLRAGDARPDTSFLP